MSRADLSVVGSGFAAGVVAAGLAGLALVGTPVLGAGVFVVQVVVALAWLAALDTRGSLGAFAITIAAAGTMDAIIGATEGPSIGQAAPVVAIALAVSLLHQLSRRPRPGATLSLAGTMSALAFGLCAASYVALRGETGGDQAVAAALLGAGVALAVGRLADLATTRPAIAPGSRRGLLGIVLGIGAAVGVGAVYGSGAGALGTGVGLRLAVIAAVLAVIADIAVDAVLAQAPPPDERRLSALTPLGVLLPVVLAGPVAYVAGRILLG
ncbi:MAG: hypothetical protein QOC82_735 [Frankiaceae bacterium]|nr:hypothetical protein [Frankiaceae bacterium]